MLEGQFLDVHPGFADVGEQPGQGAGAVRDQDGDHGVRGRAAAVLARDPVPAEVALGDRPGHRRPAADRRLPGLLPGQRAQGADHHVQVGPQRAEHLDHRSGVGAEDLRPQPRVAAGDPGDVAQPLPGQRHRTVRRLPQPGGHQARGHLRHVRDQGHRLVVIVRGHRHRDGTERQGQPADGVHPVRARLGARADRPRAAEEQVTARRHRPGTLPAGQRVTPDVATEVDPAVLQLPQHPGLDAGDVGDGGRRAPGQLRRHHLRRHVGRGGDHDQGGFDVAGVDRAGPQVPGQGECGGRRVGQRDPRRPARQPEPHAGTQQTGPHDPDRSQRRRHGRVETHRWSPPGPGCGIGGTSRRSSSVPLR